MSAVARAERAVMRHTNRVNPDSLTLARAVLRLAAAVERKPGDRIRRQRFRSALWQLEACGKQRTVLTQVWASGAERSAQVFDAADQAAVPLPETRDEMR